MKIKVFKHKSVLSEEYIIKVDNFGEYIFPISKFKRKSYLENKEKTEILSLRKIFSLRTLPKYEIESIEDKSKFILDINSHTDFFLQNSTGKIQFFVQNHNVIGMVDKGVQIGLIIEKKKTKLRRYEYSVLIDSTYNPFVISAAIICYDLSKDVDNSIVFQETNAGYINLPENTLISKNWLPKK